MILYLLLLENGAYYTGITPDLEKRLAAHTGKIPGGARCTRMAKPVALAAAWETDPRSARGLEVLLKRFSHTRKAALAADPASLAALFPERSPVSLDPAPYASFFSTPARPLGDKA